MIYPKFLKEGDTIGVPSPSAGSKDENKVNRYKTSLKNFKSWGYNIVLSKNIYKNYMGRSADKVTRGKDGEDKFEIELDGYDESDLKNRMFQVAF